MRKNLVFVVLIVLAALLLTGTVSAQNMSISNLGLSGKQDVLIYDSTGVLISTYNTSSPFVPLPASDFSIVLKPTQRARFTNPMLLLQDGLDFITQTENLIPIAIFLCLLILATGLYYKGRH